MSSAVSCSDSEIASRTDIFSMVRSALKGTADVSQPELASIIDDLRILREESLKMSTNCRTDKGEGLDDYQQTFYELFIRCWRCLSKLTEYNSQFALPSLYVSEHFNYLLRKSSDSLFSLEVGCRKAGDNPIYCGCKGVGKTTLLDAVGKISAVLLEEVIPIYWSYEMSTDLPPLLKLLTDAVKTYGILNSSDFPIPTTISGIIRTTNRRPLFLLDEFTCLYPLGISIVREILKVGKEMDWATVILAASTNFVEDFVYPKTSHCRKDYPDLNNSVFIKHTIHPIRDIISLEEYCKFRFPAWKISGDVLLDKTGGVGRFIANYNNSRTSWVPPSIYNAVISCPELLAVCNAILSTYSRSDNLNIWPTFGISLVVARNLLMEMFKLPAHDAMTLIRQWTDELILYKTDREIIEFLIPQQARELLKHIDAEDNLRMSYTLFQTLRGFEGGSPGHQNEGFLCNFIQTFKKMKIRTEGTLEFTGRNAEFQSKSTNGSTSTTIKTIDCLCDTLTKWKNESGLDRFWLTTVDNALYTINAIQIKTGMCKGKITKGVLSTQRNMTNCSSMDDTTVAGILAKAEVGFGKLAILLKLSFPTAMFQLGSLSVYCTKKVEKAIINFQEINPLSAESLELQPSLIKKLEEKFAIVPGRVSFDWEIHGLEQGWLEDVLPPEIFNRVFPSGFAETVFKS